MTQEIIVILIGIAVLVYLLLKFKCFFYKKDENNRCDDCPGCLLRPKK
jgi:uncharacterized membrane protein YuzA (DUF378 family)